MRSGSIGWSVAACLATLLYVGVAAARPADLPRLKVSENGRFLVKADGSPFFWLGDTGWWMRRIGPSDVELYLTTRARQGFTVIQMHPGYDTPDYAGNTPFLNGDTETPNEAFWQYTDLIVRKARDHGLYVALVPMWGAEYGRAMGSDAEKAYRFGQWVGRRYADQSHVLYIVSGEYDSINDFSLPINEVQRSIINAVARGLREGSGGRQLMTIHPGAAVTSSLDFHAESWLSFNMLQSGHIASREAYGMPEVYALISSDYARSPTKPVLDGEPMYEDTPDAIWTDGSVSRPRADAGVMRRKAYWSVFAGACGHTYGHNDVYGFFEPAPPGQVMAPPQGSGQRGDWKAALEAPGGRQMKHLRALIESRPFLTRVPDQSLVAPGAPSEGKLTHLVYTRAADGRAVLYVDGRPEATGQVAGTMDNWDAGFHLALANELTQDRPWLGEYHLVAVYDRTLTAEEVQQHFKGGSRSVPVDALVLYTFTAGAGDVVGDASRARGGITLRISDPSAVEWVKDGGLAIRAPVLIASVEPSAELSAAIAKTRAISIEAWVKPATTAQSGPARIVTLSQNPLQRNFALGQEADTYEVRLRTTATSENGLPGVTTPAREAGHVQATRDADGSYAMIYVPAAGQTVAVDTGRLSGERLKGWWYDPRTGKATALKGDFPVGGKLEFTTPPEGPDWVLVLDDATREYPRPGTS